MVVWLVAAAIETALAVGDARQGIDAVDQARAHLSGSDLVAERPLPPLHSAHVDFESASNRLESPWLAPARWLPVIGRQLHSVQDLSNAAVSVTQVGARSISQAHVILGMPHSAGPERVATLRRLADLATATHAQLEGVSLGPSNALIGPIASRRAQFASQLDKVRTGLVHASTVASTVADILQGPQRYLLLAANNAEMRSGSGMFLEAGVLSSDNGNIQIGDLASTADLVLSGAGVPISGDLAARWGWLNPNVEWRNLGVTPQFDVNGPLAAEMWGAATGQQVDGVLAVDVETLRQLLSVTGPVEVGGTTVSSSNVVPLLLHDQYVGLDYGSAAQQAQQARKDLLGSLAKAVLDALQNRTIDLSSLATAMTSSAAGRHILAWSSAPAAQAAWVAGGVAGELKPNTVFASVINRGGNKLDQYLSMRSRLDLVPDGNVTKATLTVDLRNQTPPGQSAYIAGPYPGLGTSYGEYVGLFTVNFPGYATNGRIAGSSLYAAAGPEGPTNLLAIPVSLMPGSARRMVITFRLPGSHGSVDIPSTARIPAVVWRNGSADWNDNESHVVSW